MRKKAIPTLLLLLMLTAATACGGGSGASTSDAGPRGATAAATPPSPPKSSDLSGLNPVQAGVRRLAFVQSYRAAVIVDTEGGDKIEGSFEFAAPDRYHLTVGGSVPVEVVTIGADSYVKTAGRWQRVEPTFLPFSAQELIAEIDQIAAAGATQAGQRDAPAGACTIYKVARADGSEAEFCAGGDGPIFTASFKDGATTVTMTFTDFDTPIEIKQPAS